MKIWLAILPLTVAAAQTRDFAGFARDLTDLQALSRVDFVSTKMASTYDRTGGNSDGFRPEWVKDGVYTIADLKGPGVVRRFYSAKPGGRLRIYVDGAPRPVIDMSCEEFFSGRRAPFVRPMVGPMGGANYSFFPIPYAKAIRIETASSGSQVNPYGQYYQVTYQTFPPGTTLRSLQLPLPAADETEWRRIGQAWRNVGTDPKPAPPEEKARKLTLRVPPGHAATLTELAGPAVIDRLLLQFQAADPSLLRSTLIRIRWDDEQAAAVDCPIGDFFGNGYKQAPYKSLPIGLNESGYYFYFPMPFTKRAKLEIVNEDKAASIELRGEIAWHPVDALPAGTGYFHAKWRRQEVAGVDLHQHNQTGEYNYRILDVEGQGRYIGANLNVFNRHLVWWGEGDPMIFVDGETWPPSIHGTGTEEYFNDAWGFHNSIEAVGSDPDRREQNVIPVSGVLMPGLAAPSNCYGPNAVFTFHLSDSIPFRRRIVVTIEHGTENDLTNDYSSTAYWYARPGGHDFFTMRPAAERAVIPEREWSRMREEKAVEYVAELRVQLAETAREIPGRPTNAERYRARLVLIRRLLRLLGERDLPDSDRARMQARLQGTLGGPDAVRWSVMDEILLELSRMVKAPAN